MNRIFEGIILWLVGVMVIFVMCLLVYTVKGDAIKADNQLNLYTECLTTDYDKFQCYSMIYGDK